VSPAAIEAALAPGDIRIYPVLDLATLQVRNFPGNFQGRAAADGFCVGSPNRPRALSRVPGTFYRALISTSAADEIQDFVTR
jgi:hypothetical protein